MSRLDELIKELCPNGVEYKTIEELCEVQNGYTPSKKNAEYWENGDVPWFRMEDIRINGKILNDAIQYVHHSGVKGDGFPAYSIVFATTATIGEHALIEVPFLCNQQLTHIHIKDSMKQCIDIKYLFYYADLIDEMCKKNVKGGSTLPAVSLDKFRKFKIAVPPLEVQSEIIRILDNLLELTSELISELTSELVARKRQYKYYQKKLLSFNTENVKWIKLQDLFNTRNGYTPAKSNPELWENGTIPWFRMEDIRENGRILSDAIQKVSIKAVKGTPFPANSIIVSTSATIGEHALLKCESLANQRFTYLMLKDEYKDLFDYKFLYYYCFKLDEYCLKCLNQGNFASVDINKFNKFEFPIIAIEEQKRIVAILDHFGTLYNDIITDLPVEIEARRKQYEYYRDKLLTFREIS